MDFSKFTDEELEQLKRKWREKLSFSFVALALGGIIFYLSMNELIPLTGGLILMLTCFIGSLINTFWLSFAKITPIEKEQQRRSWQQNQQKITTIVPADCKTMVTLVSSNAWDLNMFGYGLKKGQAYYIWKANGALNFFPAIANVQDPKALLKSIPLSDILFYEEIGERYHETKISGGGGRNVSIAGAMVGNAIGGTAGAVLLGNKGPKPINSRDVVHDTRAVSLRVPNQVSLNFSYGDYNTFLLVIPEKAATAISAPKETKTAEVVSSADEIVKYKKLLDDGIITQEEFNAKKKQLLNL